MGRDGGVRNRFVNKKAPVKNPEAFPSHFNVPGPLLTIRASTQVMGES